jgi:excinuclease ABC subunit B
LDNRPLKFEEFEQLRGQAIYVSATPGDYELQRTEGVVVEQVVRPTGLLDPPVEVRPLDNQVDDLLEELQTVIAKGFRALVLTLTKDLSQKLAQYLADLGIKARYLHSEVKALDRVEILQELRTGDIDVLVGINLLREGLDLPEVALVAILDADKEGFLRSKRAFIQIAGRAARNAEGRVILYADKITDSMQELLDETERRRRKQITYNEVMGITPQTIRKANKDFFGLESRRVEKEARKRAEELGLRPTANTKIILDPLVQSLPVKDLEKLLDSTRKRMLEAATNEDYLTAARFRDEMFELESVLAAKTENTKESVK